jgi:hypothetical protein
MFFNTRPISSVAMAAVAVLTAAPAFAQATKATLCTPAEVVVFACRTGAKAVSVCASADASASRGYVQYRFGTPAPAAAPELVLPAQHVVPPQAAIGQTESFSAGGGAWLAFTNGDVSYTVFTGIGNWGPKGEKRTLDGILVKKGGNVIAALSCNTPPTSELGPDWFSKVGITGHDEDFEFPIDRLIKK